MSTCDAPPAAGIPEIRRLVPRDAPRHRALMLEAYARAPEAFTSSASERAELPLAWWEKRVAEDPDPPELACGAFAGGELVGAAGLVFERRERTRHKATLVAMYVRAEWRRGGLGRRLVEEILRQAAASPHAELVQLTVTATNQPALALYTGCGFVVFGTEPMAVRYGERYLAKIHLWRRVERPQP